MSTVYRLHAPWPCLFFWVLSCDVGGPNCTTTLYIGIVHQCMNSTLSIVALLETRAQVTDLDLLVSFSLQEN
jgi:hypothetical protein